ncbi:MAG: phospholipid-binding protein MlaC [Gammaproteobacteria bacterium]
MKRFVSTAAAFVLAIITCGAWAQEAPLETVRSTTSEVVSRVKDEKDTLRSDPTKMYNLVSEMIFPHFDFGVMSQFVLGEQWKAADETKRAAFVEQFRKLLVRTYAAALLEYSDQTIQYPDPGPQPTNAKTAVVKQDITQASGAVLPVVYRLHNKTGDWKVFDVSVDGVSLVKTYRSSFTSILKEGGIDQLIANLATKNQEIGQ